MKIERRILPAVCLVVLGLGSVNAQAPCGGKYPEASSRYLTDRDLAGRTRWELKIMRNEIFARHGCRFQTEEMRRYFNEQEWYEPRYDEVSSRLTEVEIANIELIKQYEAGAQEEGSPSEIREIIEKQKREVVFRAQWGSGPAELGCIVPQEASPEGPSSFALDSSGRIFVLDQVNKRVQLYDYNGEHIRAIPISSSTFSDIEIGQSGNLFLLDPWTEEAIVLIDEEGNELNKVGLIGKGIPERGRVWQIFSRQDGLWVSYDDYVVRIYDPYGEEDKDRPMATGQFSSDGSYLLAARKLGDITVTVTSRNILGGSGTDRYTAYFDIPVLFINLLDTDGNGNIYLGVELLEESVGNGPPYGIDRSHEVVVVFDGRGEEKRRIYMPVSSQAIPVVRSFRVAADGTIYQLVLGEEEATMWRYSP
jgi:hypothetical protein